MADYTTSLYDEQVALTLPSTKTTAFPKTNSRLIEVTVPAGIAGGETIAAYVQGISTTVRPTLCRLYTDGAGTAVVLDIGDEVDPDRYADGIDVSTAGIVEFCSGTEPAAVATPHLVVDSTKVLLITVASMTTWPAGSKLYIELVSEF